MKKWTVYLVTESRDVAIANNFATREHAMMWAYKKYGEIDWYVL